MAPRNAPAADSNPSATPKQGRQHKATYATDKRKGGYLVRVVGPHAAEFAGREVPVTRRDDTETTEKLVKIVWTGKDVGTPDQPGTGQPVSLYTFQAKPRDLEPVAF